MLSSDTQPGAEFETPESIPFYFWGPLGPSGQHMEASGSQHTDKSTCRTVGHVFLLIFWFQRRLRARIVVSLLGHMETGLGKGPVGSEANMSLFIVKSNQELHVSFRASGILGKSLGGGGVRPEAKPILFMMTSWLADADGGMACVRDARPQRVHMPRHGGAC